MQDAFLGDHAHAMIWHVCHTSAEKKRTCAHCGLAAMVLALLAVLAVPAVDETEPEPA